MARRKQPSGWDWSRHTTADIAKRFPEDPSKPEGEQKAYWARTVLDDQDAYLDARGEYHQTLAAVKGMGGLSVRDVAWVLGVSHGHAHNLVREYGREDEEEEEEEEDL